MVTTPPVHLVRYRPPYRLFRLVPCVVCALPATAFWPSVYVEHGERRCVLDRKAMQRIDRRLAAQMPEAAA